MSTPLPPDIVRFLNAQTCANICCIAADNTPYCFTCFFYFDEEQSCIYFKSQMQTHHAALLEQNGRVAGTILEDTLNTLQLKGVQFQGFAKRNSIFDIAPAMKYHARYPMAVAIPGEMWTLYFESIKFTDNSQGFGHKTHWSARSQSKGEQDA